MVTAALYVQNTLQLRPAHAGLLFPVFNLAVIAGSLLSPPGIHSIGARRLLVSGFTGIAIGVALLLPLPADDVRLALLISGFTVMGLSLGLASVASTTAGTTYVVDGERGVAAGVLSSSAQLGTALGLAVCAPLIASAAPMTGYRLGFLTAIVIALAGAAAALTVPLSIRRTAGAGALS
jgi:MFS family permease